MNTNTIKHLDQSLNHFFQISTDYMCIASKDGYFKKVNPAFQRLIGESEEDILNTIFISYIHPEDRNHTSNYFTRLFEGEKNLNVLENRYMIKNGNYRWLQWASTSLIDDEYIYAIAHDVSEQKKKELEMMDSELKLMHFIDLIPHPVFLKNQKNEYILCNQAQADLFSVSKETLMGKDDIFFIQDHKELESIRNSDAIVQQEKKSLTLPEQIITVLSGEKRTLHTTKIPFDSQLTGEVHILGVSIDLTEIKKAEGELKEINFELDTFVYHSSHDLRAPLCSLLGLLNLLKKDNTQAMKDACIHEAIKTIGKLDRFISDLTNFSRNTRLEVLKEKIDFTTIMNECCDDLRFMEGTDKISINLEIEEGVDLFSDSQRIKIIFMNLISNAIKYRNPQSDTSFLSIKVFNTENKIAILFEDNGIGIQEQYREKVFDMFFRASDNSYGSGLGLYIVKQTIEKLRGKVQVSSAIGKGTSFHITLPAIAREKRIVA